MSERAPKFRQELQPIPFKIVGGNKFGRYKKISVEATYNMIVSDNTLVDYAGYTNVLSDANSPGAEGRGIFSSTIQDIMVAVIGASAFKITAFGPNLMMSFLGGLATSSGEVHIAENNAGQIALSDFVNIYIYTPTAGTFDVIDTQTLFGFKPGFISFQDTRFITPAVGTPNWRLSANNDGKQWPNDSQHVGVLQTKPDTVQAGIPFPGRGNMLFLFGHTVAEQQTDVGAALFPYQRSSSFNVDYGCINPSSIAYQGNFIVWVGFSEESGPVIMYSTGGEVKEISTDGIDFLLSQLKKPEDCSGFLIKLDGHLIYQVTFKTDNITLLYDFESELFFYASDENLNYHVARKIVYFNNNYYFVSFNDGNVYQFGTEFTTYRYSDTVVYDIPRLRFTPPVRLPSSRWFIGRDVIFTMEQGQKNIIDEPSGPSFLLQLKDGTPILLLNGTEFGLLEDDNLASSQSNMRVLLSMSRDGGETYDNFQNYDMNPTGHRKSIVTFQRLGQVNDCSFQLQFWGSSRFVVFDGILNTYQ